MGNTTIYDISVRYRTEGTSGVNGKLAEMGRQADKTGSAFAGLRSIVAGVFAFKGVGMLKDALIGTNAALESTKVGMAAIIGSKLHVSFERAEGAAARLVEDYRQIAKSSPGTANDFIDMNNAISGAVLGSGGNIKQLKSLTTGAVIGAKAFGIRADMAGLDITQALTGKIEMKDRFARMLVEPLMSVKKFNKLSAEDRMATLNKALNSPVMKAAAEKYGKSWDGVTSTLKDNISIAFQKIGLPLFQRISKEIARWNVWIEKNQATIQALASKFSGALVSGFNAVRGAVSWIIDNRKTLMVVAGAFGALKIATGVGGLIGGGLSKLGALQAVGIEAAKSGNALTGMASAIGKATMGLNVFAAAFAAGTWLGTKYDVTGTIDPLAEATKTSRARWIKEDPLGYGRAMARHQLLGLDQRYASSKLAQGLHGVAGSASGKSMIDYIGKHGGKLAKMFGIGPDALDDMRGKAPKDPSIKVGKIEINVASENPDIFAVGVQGALRKMVRESSQAEFALRSVY